MNRLVLAIAALIAGVVLILLPSTPAAADDTVTPTPVGTVYTHTQPEYASVLIQPYYIGAAVPLPH